MISIGTSIEEILFSRYIHLCLFEKQKCTFPIIFYVEYQLHTAFYQCWTKWWGGLSKEALLTQPTFLEHFNMLKVSIQAIKYWDLIV